MAARRMRAFSYPATDPGTDPATLLHFLFRDNGSTLVDGALAPVAVGAQADIWLNLGTDGAQAEYITNKPTRRADGVQSPSGDGMSGGNFRDFGTNDFWVDFIITRSGSNAVVPIAGNDDENQSGFKFNASGLTITDNDGNALTLGTILVSGSKLVRVKRVSGTVTAYMTGGVTASGSLAGAITPLRLFGSANQGYTGSSTRTLVVGMADHVLTVGEAAASVQWYTVNYGLGIS